MAEYMPYIISGGIFVVVAAVIFVIVHAHSGARLKRLMEMGFSFCPEDNDSLLENITSLENNAEYTYTVHQPMKAKLSGKDIYFYEKSRHRTGSVYASDEFLLPLTRPSDQGVMLFIKPSRLPSGAAARFIGATATGAWDSQPDDLAKIEIPPDLQESNLIGVLGPAGSSLYDLIDKKTLDLMMQTGDFGAFIVMCRGGLCSLGSPRLQIPLDVTKAWAFIKELLV